MAKYGATQGKKILIGFAVLVFAGAVMTVLEELVKQPVIDSNPHTIDDSARKLDACVYARQAIREDLKSPRSADFEGSCNSTTRKIGINKYEVSGYLYAENSFGAELRNSYTCIAEFAGTKWKVACEL